MQSTLWEIDGDTVEAVSDYIFLGSKITADGDWSHEIKKCLLLGRKVMTSLDSILKSRDITLPRNVHLVKAWFFQWSCMDVRVNLEESWVQKNWCFWTMVLEKTLESPLECKDIQPVHPKGYQSWEFIGRTFAEAETPVLWSPYVKSWLIGKASEVPRDWGHRRRGQQRMSWLDGISDSMDKVWVNSGSLWWKGRPGLLQFMSSQRVIHDWGTELNWTGSVQLGNKYIHF